MGAILCALRRFAGDNFCHLAGGEQNLSVAASLGAGLRLRPEVGKVEAQRVQRHTQAQLAVG